MDFHAFKSFFSLFQKSQVRKDKRSLRNKAMLFKFKKKEMKDHTAMGDGNGKKRRVGRFSM